MWARVKEATKKGKQKWRVGDLLADERCSPAVLDLRSTHVERTTPPVEENWDSEDEAERAGGGRDGERSGEASGVVSRGLLVSGFIYNFLNGFGFFSFVIPLVRFQNAFLSRPRGGEGAAIEPVLRAGRQSRQDQDKIVCPPII